MTHQSKIMLFENLNLTLLCQRDMVFLTNELIIELSLHLA